MYTSLQPTFTHLNLSNVHGYTLLFLHVFLLQNIDCGGYSLELPWQGVLTCTHNPCCEQKTKTEEVLAIQVSLSAFNFEIYKLHNQNCIVTFPHCLHLQRVQALNQNCLGMHTENQLKFNYILDYMSRVIRQPDFCLCENKGADQLPSNCEADQRICFRYTDSTIPLLLIPKISSF